MSSNTTTLWPTPARRGRRTTRIAEITREPTTRPPARIGAREFERIVHEQMRFEAGSRLTVEHLAHGFVRLRWRFDERHLRPGGTVAGPVMFTLADTALWALTMSVAGRVTAAVTTDVTIHFLRRPQPVDLVAEARLLKHGRRLVVGEVALYSEGEPNPVAHVTGTYALPRS